LAFEDTGSVARSSSAAGVAPKTFYSWKKHDADFAASLERSKVVARDYLKNVDCNIYGAVRRYDSRLLMKLLRRMKFGVRR
jgi:hypothetical protein